MTFREQLDHILKQVEGAVACSVMGLDGMSIETRQTNQDTGADIPSLIVEYGGLLSTMRKTMRALEAGEVAEFSINTERILTIVCMLNAEYFLVLALRPEGNYGKGRYALRIAAPELKKQLE